MNRNKKKRGTKKKALKNKWDDSSSKSLKDEVIIKTSKHTTFVVLDKGVKVQVKKKMDRAILIFK